MEKKKKKSSEETETKKSKLFPTTEVGEYKGTKTICLNPEVEGFGKFSFGIKKARLILEKIDEIQNFVNKYGDESSKKK